jgi:NAD(P)-dependent dehydrogenase (short-subunit alcohol dehydrogenase family)
MPLTLDVTSRSEIENSVEQVKKLTGENGLYGLVNNAGVTMVGPLEFQEEEQLRKVFEVNLFGMANVTKAFLPLMRLRQESGGNDKCQIVNISSVAGRQGYPFFTAYNSSKFAVKGLTEALRLELINSKINVSLIEPGAIATEIWDKSEREIDDLKKKLKNLDDSYYSSALEKSSSLLSKARSKAASPELIAKLILDIMEMKKQDASYLIGPDSALAGFATKFIPEKIRHKGILKEFGFH